MRKKKLVSLLCATVLTISSFTNVKWGNAATVISVDPSVQNQEIEGWGTSLCWWADVIGGWSDENLDNLMDMLYDETTGLGFNIARYNIGGGENPTHNHMRAGGAVPGYQPESGVWDWDADARQVKILMEARDRGANILEAFSNSPPYWMTKSGCTAGNGSGPIFATNNLRDDMYGEFANYITEVVKHFDEELGIRFRTLSPINEPVDPVWYNGNGQEGCTYDRGSQNKILKEVGKQLEAKGLNTKLSGPEENSIDKTRDSYNSYDSETKAYISQINTHSYAGSDRTTLKTIASNDGKTLWQSEYGTGGDWRESGSHDHDGMKWPLRLADTIAKDLNEMQAVGWVYWQAIEGEEGAISSNHSWGLIHANFETANSEEFWLPKQYFTMANYSKFIRPGYQIIGTNNGNTVAAYDKENNKLVLVVANHNTGEESQVFDLSAFNNVNESVEVYRTSRNENLATLEPIHISDNSFSVTAPAESVTTYVLSGVVYDENFIKINDMNIGTGNNQFEYVGSWSYNNQSNAYQHDNHWSSKAGDYYLVRFTGTQVKLYGSRNMNHGIAGISIDGRPEIKYDCYSIPREDNVLIYTSPILAPGEHTLKVRVTGEKSWASTGYNVIADRVDVINAVPTDVNLAVGKPTTASSEQTFNKNTAYNGNDANLSTRWAANNKNLGHWWEVDLGDYFTLTGTEITWEFDGKLYKYKIEVSSDRVNWQVALDKTVNTVTTQVQQESFNVDNARYVRVTITDHQSWPSFYEFKAFGY